MTFALVALVVIGLLAALFYYLGHILDAAFKAIDAHQKEGPWE